MADRDWCLATCGDSLHSAGCPSLIRVDPYPKEKVVHPQHYGGDTVYETIKVIEAWRLDFHLGNAVKYISRAGRKEGSTYVEDLEKAHAYLTRALMIAKGEEPRWK